MSQEKGGEERRGEKEKMKRNKKVRIRIEEKDRTGRVPLFSVSLYFFLIFLLFYVENNDTK